jgi:hypothetical protein
MLFPEMSFYKCGFQNHFKLTFSCIVTFAGTGCGELLSTAMWYICPMNSQVAGEETKVFLVRGFIYAVKVNVQM